MGKLIPVIGRRNEKKRILDSLNSDDISGVIIYGPPYVGKTLLLKSLAEEWIGQNGFHSVYCDVAKYDKLPVSELIKQLSARLPGISSLLVWVLNCLPTIIRSTNYTIFFQD